MEEVIHLGFDSAVEDLGVLCSATNRAVAQLRRELCPATGRFMLTVRPPIATSGEERSLACGEACEIVFPNAVALSFESIGACTVGFEADGVIFREESMASPEWRERKFLFAGHRGARVVLTGTKDFCLRNIAVFDGVEYADNSSALPIISGPFVRFDVSAFCNDFLAIDGDPFNEMGFAVRGYEIFGKKLSLPAQAGRVEVAYQRKLNEAKMDDFADESTAEPDVPEEYADMLPLCVASYVWADVEPEKAAYYKQMYNEQLQYAKLQQKHRGGGRVIDRKGWR